MDKSFKGVKITFWIFFSLSIILNAFIIFQSCLPASSSMLWSNVFVDMVNNISHSTGGGNVSEIAGIGISDFIRKSIGHFSLFLVDGVIIYLMFYFLTKFKAINLKNFIIIPTLLLGIFIASLSEFIQYFIPTRAGLIADVGIDVLGYIVGAGITFAITLIVDHHKKKLALSE